MKNFSDQRLKTEQAKLLKICIIPIYIAIEVIN